MPTDVKLIGFDNLLYSRLSIPSISTIERYPEQLAQYGCDTLIRIIRHETLTSQNISVPVKLIERESTK